MTAYTPARTEPAQGIPHPRQWPVYDDDVVARSAELLARGRSFDYGYGPELSGFEAAFAERHGRSRVLALASGTAGLLAAYFALGIGPGDEVIVSDYTFFSTATPLVMLGAVPVLCDAGDRTGNVTAEGIEALITVRTKAIVVTHLWGHPCDMPPIVNVARRHGIPLVEDASHAHGSTYRGRPVGSFGDVAVFSCGGLKMVTGGMGGVLLTDNEDLYARACLLTNFRHRTDLTIESSAYEPFLVTGLGGNFRMSPVAAILAHSHLDRVEELVDRRHTNITGLIDRVTKLPGIEPVGVAVGCTTGAWYDGVVEVDRDCPLSRDELVSRLRAEGLRVRTPATRPLHTYPLFQGVAPNWSPVMAASVTRCAAVNNRSFPVADALAERWVTLPVNYLWDDAGAIVEPYAEVFERVVERA